MQWNKEEKAKIIQTFAINNSDTGSSSVQIALLTQRIESLTKHMQENPKDFSAKRGLIILVAQRRDLLKYLKRHNTHQYEHVVQELSLKR